MQEDTPRGDTLWVFSLQGTMGPVAAPAAATTPVPATPGPGTPSAAAETTVEITGYDIGYQPTEFTIPANTDVRVVVHNAGQLTHNFSIDKLNISATLNPGETGEVTINAPAGTYTYYCDVDGHRQAGMVGTMIVK